MEKDLKALFEEYSLLPKSPQRTKLGRKIRAEKKKLIEKKDYAEIIHVLRFLGDYERDRLFLDLLKKQPSSSLFVIAFAGSEMHSYNQAYQAELLEYDNNEETLEKDVELIFDDVLCEFLSKHDTKEDFNYVYELADGATWLEANKRVTDRLSQLWEFWGLRF